jgi:hypothetical protein
VWLQFTQDLTKAGLLVSTDRLHPVDVATTVRVRDGETELTEAVPAEPGTVRFAGDSGQAHSSGAGFESR